MAKFTYRWTKNNRAGNRDIVIDVDLALVLSVVAVLVATLI